jgi:RNA polymerase sigma-70 factor (ECF subfamily)
MWAAPLLDELARRKLPAPEHLERHLQDYFRVARVAWPDIELDGAAFVAYLAARWPEGASLDDWLAHAHASDLYLTCACARGSAGAIEAFDRAHLGGQVRDYLARSKPDDAFVEDVRQSLREKLFVGDKRKIEEYSGRGALGGWVRMLAVRMAIDLRRRRGERLPDLRHEQPAAIDPELGYLSERYRGEVEDAFRRALASLGPEQRTLLRMHFVDAVTLDELARLTKLHRATVARRLAVARKAILDATHRQLRERLAVSTEELASLVRLVRSELQISVARLLAS